MVIERQPREGGMHQRDTDIVAEGKRLVALGNAQSVPLRLLGGVAIALRCGDLAQRPDLVRAYKDIDFAAPKRAGRTVRDMLIAEGYEADREFNALHGASRLLFYDRENDRQVDCFLGTFEMCHKLDLAPRLRLPGDTLPPSDLLLLKLQVVELNRKDASDAVTLLLRYDPERDDTPDSLGLHYIGAVTGADWGWYTTLHDNLETVQRFAGEILAESEDVARVHERVDTILRSMESAPKSLSWRLRDKVGRHMAWYELPEEVGDDA
ncbi:MAG TPA: hypothetical protein VFB58_19185 [Chloroflexota bacterium]|nr:hypothetical protein [Chloroflexota bacterium]